MDGWIYISSFLCKKEDEGEDEKEEKEKEKEKEKERKAMQAILILLKGNSYIAQL